MLKRFLMAEIFVCLLVTGCSVPLQWSQTELKTNSNKEGRHSGTFSWSPSDKAPENPVGNVEAEIGGNKFSAPANGDMTAKFNAEEEETTSKNTETTLEMQKQKSMGLVTLGVLLAVAGLAIAYQFRLNKEGLLLVIAGAALITTVYYPWIWLVALVAVGAALVLGYLDRAKLLAVFGIVVKAVDKADATNVKEAVKNIAGDSQSKVVKDVITEVKAGQ